MKSIFDIAAVKRMVDKLDPEVAGKEEESGYRTAVVLLAAAVDELVAFTGYERNFVADIAARMRRAGLDSRQSQV